MGFVNVEKITSKHNEKGAQNMIIQLKILINYIFTWNTLCHTFKKTDIRKDLEVTFIVLLKPSLSEKKKFEPLILSIN